MDTKGIEIYSWLEQLGKGNHKAFTNIFLHYKDKVFSHAMLFTSSTSIGEEIVQDVFLQVWKSRSSFEKADDFHAYLFTVTRNAVYRTLHAMAMQKKKQQEWMHLQEEVEVDDMLSIILDKDYQFHLHKAIQQLPPQQQQVYKLIKQEGLSRQLVAEQLGLHPETVKRHLSLAVKSIRAYCTMHLDLAPILLFLFLGL